MKYAEGQAILSLLRALAFHIPTELEEKFMVVCTAKPVPGTGECVCKLSPEHMRKSAERAGCKTLVEYGNIVLGQKMLLDHRCPHHGEKAQPVLWGRYKSTELGVTAQEWESLGTWLP